MQRWKFGDVEITRVLEFEAPILDARTLFPDADENTLKQHEGWLKPRLQDPITGLLILAFHTYVIRTPFHLILVDTCGGNDKHRPQKPRYHQNNWPYLKNLENAGVDPKEVDYVLCTHLHVDHVGWNTRLIDGQWLPTFPNAKYLFSKTEWDFWEQECQSDTFTDDPYYEDSLLPVVKAGLAVFVDNEYAIDDWVRIVPSPGHTPGHVNVCIGGSIPNVVMSGDLMHHPIQCAEPDWNSCFCVNPRQSITTRREFLETHSEMPTLIMPAHFPSPGAGRIVPEADAWRFEFDGDEILDC